MNRLGKIAEIPAGSWTKWVVVGFWVVVLVLAFPLSKKLTGAEKNDAKYWLPGAAESTRVLNAQERFQSPNVITGVVVYQRVLGLTAADRAKAAADARMFTAIPGVVPGTIVGPVPSSDGQAIPLILVVVFVILGLLLRALVAPVVLTATVVLSFAAALGVSAFFFNHVFGFGGADTTFPLFAFVFLVALGIDYNIFLMTRVREEAIRRDARHGAIVGMAATGGVITSAGFVLAGTFAVLATIPSTFLTELGFAVAFGILLDTIVVRLLLVTALNLDIGRWMWWPSKLAAKPDPAPEELSRERAEAMVPG